jgi:hypothetical protein
MEGEVIKAIPRASRIMWVITLVSIGIVMSWVWKTVIARQLHAYLSVKDPVEAFRRFQWVMIGIGAVLVLFAAYFALFAARIIRSGQFPYPGMKVWRDTTVVRGRRALVRGWGIAFCAIWLFGLAVYAAYVPILLAKHQRSMSTSHRTSESLRSVGSTSSVEGA